MSSTGRDRQLLLSASYTLINQQTTRITSIRLTIIMMAEKDHSCTRL